MPIFLSQRGSEYWLSVKPLAKGSIQSGSILATQRAYNLLVSTNSAAITHFGLAFFKAEPGAK